MRFPTVPLALLLTGLGACSHTPPEAASAHPEPVALRLSATLVTPTDITLRWQAVDPAAAGHVVEFATEPQGPYTILQYVPPHQTTFSHPDLMPTTTFYYRLRPYYGPATPEVEVALPEGEFDEQAQKTDHSWLPPRTGPRQPAVKHPVRTSGAAAPTDLSATVMHANGVKFTWTDNASGEDGYLVEAKPAGRPGFQAVAVVDPDIGSVGLITTPDEKRAAYRVRAFYYGPPSNLAHQTTGESRG